jgi:DNA-binding NarL/FixJ family response regulator
LSDLPLDQAVETRDREDAHDGWSGFGHGEADTPLGRETPPVDEGGQPARIDEGHTTHPDEHAIGAEPDRRLERGSQRLDAGDVEFARGSDGSQSVDVLDRDVDGAHEEGHDALLEEASASPGGVKLEAATKAGRIRVALLNDYDVVVAGLAAMLQPYRSEIAVMDVSTSRPTRRSPIDVVLYDSYGRPGLDMSRVSETAQQANVKHLVVFTFDFHPRLIDDALACGAHGYLWKGLPSEQLVHALRRVTAGEVVVSDPRPLTHPLDAPELDWPLRERGLTARESEALALLVLGLRNTEIAMSMYVSVDTVKTHLRNVYRKLQVRNRAEAVAVALAHPTFTRKSRDELLRRGP